jgi:glycerol kinase
VAEFVGALDQGTTSTRFIIFGHDGREVARHQAEHTQLMPKPGWVEHDPVELLGRSRRCMSRALLTAGLSPADLAAIGVTNQRETTVIWDRRTGLPFCNAIVWQDTRSDQAMADLERRGAGNLIRERTGLLPATYFSAGKLQWALENDSDVRSAAVDGTAFFGTVETWLLWNLTGGPRGGAHVTDVTNASRTMLMDLRTLAWDDELLTLFGVPRQMLPEIVPSSGRLGEVRIDGAGNIAVPLTAALGDQQAAMVGQLCLKPGDAKNTYGTGSFLLVNTGSEIVRSNHGLLTTVCYQMEGEGAAYALEGSVAMTGAVVQWLRDQLGLIASSDDIETLAGRVQDAGGCYFVPAFSGLFAPYWRPDARGVIVGLTRATTKAHLARAALEAICFQTKDVLRAMAMDAGSQLEVLKVDGGVTVNSLCMQLQADVLGVPVSRPVVAETTALGAAYAAGCAVGFWSGYEELRGNWQESRRWSPAWDGEKRAAAYSGWQKAVARSLDWAETSQ